MVKDDPTADGDDEFGLITDNLFAPFSTAGATVYFQTSAPTYNQVEQLRHEVICLEHWDPATVQLQLREPENAQQEYAKEITVSAIRNSNGIPFQGFSINQMAVPLSDKFAEAEPSRVLCNVSTALDEKQFSCMLMSKLVTTERHIPITVESIALKFGIGLESAKKTLQVTTQWGIRHTVHPIHCQYHMDHFALHWKRLAGTWFMDRLDARYKSMRGNTGAHVIMNGKYTRVYPRKDRSFEMEKDVLADFINNVGILEQLITNGAPSYSGHKTPFRKLCTRK